MAEHTKKLRGLQDGLRARLKELREDRATSAEEKARLTREAQESFRENYRHERASVLEDLEVRRLTAFRIAHPAERPEKDAQDALLKEQQRTRVHRELTAQWAGRNGGPTLQEYEGALASGDELRIEAMEVYGPGATSNDDMRSQFSRKVAESRSARMPDEQRRAFEEIEELEKTGFETEVALGFLDQTSRELTSPTAT